MRLYTYFRSSASYSVRIALNLKGLAYESIPVHLIRDGGEQHAASYTALNPAALVPLLVDGDVTLSQSLAIIEYLEETYSEPPLLPGDGAGRARVRAIAQTIACDIHPLGNLRVMRYLDLQLGASTEARRAWYRHWVTRGFAVIEQWLGDAASTGRHCHGDRPTVADCFLVPQVFNSVRMGVSMAPYPRIQRIADTCSELESFQRAAPQEQPDAESVQGVEKHPHAADKS